MNTHEISHQALRWQYIADAYLPVPYGGLKCVKRDAPYGAVLAFYPANP
ncbi:hypothetical protein WJ542_05555 [Paraburkholderia sp. B3]